MKERLQPLREAIDSVDEQLVRLIDERLRLAAEVGRIKQESSAPVYQPEREAQILRRVVQMSQAPVAPASLEAIYREILSAGRAIQQRQTVAYLGPPGTFSELALIRQFGSSVEALSCHSIDEVFRSAESGRADFAVVPVENSSEGAVSRSLDLLLATPLGICAEVSVPVQLHLLSRSGTLDGVQRVLAHPQPLGQCVGWLQEHVPHLEQVPVASNAEAARQAALDPTAAAISGEQAAKRYGLMAVASYIQDNVHNRTRFLVLGRAQTASSGRDKTSLVLSVANRAGAIYDLLGALARHEVSMSRLESRPARNGAWEYNFFIDVEGHSADDNVAAALRELQQGCAFYRCLGSYPRDA